MTSTTNRPATTDNVPFRRVRGGFTLLEILLSLALVALLLAGVNSVIRLFSGHYSSVERRIGRAQLSRSISQMLSDDLGAAVQDPISSLDDDPNRRFIRRFGLRGDSRSLQIDVVQPNLFATTATAEENRRVAQGGKKSAESRQVPELKTIFYEFEPLNAPEPSDADAAEISASATAPNESGGENLGSDWTGSLLATSGSNGDFGENDADAAESGFGSGATSGFAGSNDGSAARPLVRKFGLSRRELDFETPDDESTAQATQNAIDSALAQDADSSDLGSRLSGSLSAPPDASRSTLASSGGAQTTGTAATSFENKYENEKTLKTPLTAAQIAMDADDGTTWAPEVLDCRFRYFDGENWLDSWDSIEKAGLPIAIKVDLKLAPLDDVDAYRNSILLAALPVPPKPSSVEKITAKKSVSSDSTEFSSRLVGSLTTPGATAANVGVDVFNSYRPLSAIRAAAEAPSTTFDASFSPYRTNSETTALGTSSGTAAAPDAASSVDVAGSLATAAAANGAAPAPLAPGTQDSSNRAVVNTRGVCVDYGNDGSYTTLERIAEELGLSEPTVCEVVAYLPTTPFGRTETLARRRPATVRAGTVAVRDGSERESSAARRAAGANPYATGRARSVQRRTPNERTTNDRSVAERSAATRTAATRGVENRSSETREGVARRPATRAVSDRGGAERAVANRELRTRDAGVGGRGANAELAAALDAEGGVLGASVGAATEEFGGTEPVGGVGTPDASGIGASTVGGLSVPGTPGAAGSPSGGGLSPFELLDSQNVPFSNGAAGFAAVDAANGVDGTTFQPGLVETSGGGAATTVSPTKRGDSTSNPTRQTWIRGKK